LLAPARPRFSKTCPCRGGRYGETGFAHVASSGAFETKTPGFQTPSSIAGMVGTGMSQTHVGLSVETAIANWRYRLFQGQRAQFVLFVPARGSDLHGGNAAGSVRMIIDELMSSGCATIANSK
jgi:hypothetical protein